MVQPMAFPQQGGALAGAAGAGGMAPMQRAPMQAAPTGGALGAAAPAAPTGAAGMMSQAVEGAPQQLEGDYQAVAQAVASGRVSAADVQQLGHLAATALEDPRLYPSVARLAQRLGLGELLPPQPDPQALSSLALVAHRIGREMGGGQAPTQNAAPQVPSMRQGGYIPRHAPKNGMNVALHPGEVVVSAPVVEAKGLDFFRKMHETKKQGG